MDRRKLRVGYLSQNPYDLQLKNTERLDLEDYYYSKSHPNATEKYNDYLKTDSQLRKNSETAYLDKPKDKDYSVFSTQWLKDTWSEFFQDMNKAQADDFAGQYQRAQEHLDLIDGAKQHINNQLIFSALRSYFQKKNKGQDVSKELSTLQNMYPNVDLSGSNADSFLKNQYLQKSEQVTNSNAKKAYDDLVKMTSSGSLGVINDWMRKIGISMHDNSQKEFNSVTGAMQDWFGDRVTDAGVLLSGMENVSNGEKLKMLDAYSKQLKDVLKYSKVAQEANEKEQAWYDKAHKVSDEYKRRIEKSQRDMLNGGSMWTVDNIFFANTQQMGFSSSSWDKLTASMLLQIGAGGLAKGAITAARIVAGSALGLTGAAAQISAGKSENNAEVVENLKTKIRNKLSKNPEVLKAVLKEGHAKYAGKTDDEILDLIAHGDYLPEKSKALHSIADTVRETLADSRAGVNTLFEKDQYAVTSDALFDTALYMGMPLKGLGSAIGRYANTSAKLAPVKKAGKWIVERGGKNVERAFNIGMGTGAGIPGGVVAAGLQAGKNVAQSVARLGIDKATKGGLIRNATAWAEREVAAGEKWFLKQKAKLHAKDVLKDNIIQNRINRYIKTPANLISKIVASGYSEAIEEGKQYENAQEWINNEDPKRSISFMEGIMEDASRGTSLIIPALGIPFGAQWGISGKGELYSNMAGGWLGGAMHTAMVSGGIDAVGMLTTPHSISISNMVAQNSELGRNIALSRYTKGIDLARTVERDPNTASREIQRFKEFNQERKKLGLSYIDDKAIDDEQVYADDLYSNLNNNQVREQLESAGIEYKSDDWYKAVSALTLYQNMGRESLKEMIQEEVNIDKLVDNVENQAVEKQKEIDEENELMASTVFGDEETDAIENGPVNRLVNHFKSKDTKHRAKTFAKQFNERRDKEIELELKAENGDKRAKDSLDRMKESDIDRALNASVAAEELKREDEKKPEEEKELSYGDILKVVAEVKGLLELKDDIDVADDYSEKRSHHDRRFFDAEIERRINKIIEKSGLDKKKLQQVLEHPERFVEDQDSFSELKKMYQNKMSANVGATVSNMLKSVITGKRKNLRKSPAGTLIHDGWHLSKAKDLIQKLDKSVNSSDELVDKINQEYERESMGLDAEVVEEEETEASVTPDGTVVEPGGVAVTSEDLDTARQEVDDELRMNLQKLKDRLYEDELVDLEIDAENMLDQELDEIGFAIMNSAFIDGNVQWKDAVVHAYNTLVKFGFKLNQINKIVPFFKQWYMAASVNPLYIDQDGFSSRRDVLSNPAQNIIQDLTFDYEEWIEQKKKQLGLSSIFDSEEEAFSIVFDIQASVGDTFGIVENRDVTIYTIIKTDDQNFALDIDDEFGNPIARDGKLLTKEQIESFKRGYNSSQKAVADSILKKIDDIKSNVEGEPSSYHFFVKEADGKIHLYKRVRELTGDQYDEEISKQEARKSVYNDILTILRSKDYDKLKNVSVQYKEHYHSKSKKEEYEMSRTLGDNKHLQRYIDFIKQWDNPSEEDMKDCAEGLTAILLEQQVSPSLYMSEFLQNLIGQFFNTEKESISSLDWNVAKIKVYGKEVSVKAFIPEGVYKEFIKDLTNIRKKYEDSLRYKIVSSSNPIFATLTDEQGNKHRVADYFKYLAVDEHGKVHIIDIASSGHTFIEQLANGAKGPHYNNAPLFGKYGAKRTFIEQRSMGLSAYVQMLSSIDNSIQFAEYPIETIPIRIKLNYTQVVNNLLNPSDTEHPGVTQLFAYRNGEPYRIPLNYTNFIYGQNLFEEEEIESLDEMLQSLMSLVYDSQERLYELLERIQQLEDVVRDDANLLEQVNKLRLRVNVYIDVIENDVLSSDEISSTDALNIVKQKVLNITSNIQDISTEISKVYYNYDAKIREDEITVDEEINAENEIKRLIRDLKQRYDNYNNINDVNAQRREYAKLLNEADRITSIIADFKKKYPNNKNKFDEISQLHVAIKNLTSSDITIPFRYVRRNGMNYKKYNTIDKNNQESAVDLNGNKDENGRPVMLKDVCGEPEFSAESVTEVVRTWKSNIDGASMITVEIQYKGYRFNVYLRVADGKAGTDFIAKITNLLAQTKRQKGRKVILTGMDRTLGFVKDSSKPIDVTQSMIVPLGTTYADINMYDTLTEGNRKFKFYLSSHENPVNRNSPIVLRDEARRTVYTFPKVYSNGSVVDGGRGGKVYVMMTPDYRNKELSPDPIVIPVLNQHLSTDEINFILNIFRNISNSTYNLTDKVRILLKDGGYQDLDCTYKDLISMYIPYGNWDKKRPATKISLNGSIVTIQFGENSQSNMAYKSFDMSNENDTEFGLPALMNYMKDMFIHISSEVIYSDTVDSDVSVFSAVQKFFKDNPEEDTLLFGNTRLVFYKENFKKNGTPLSGLAWMMQNQMMMTDAEKLVNPRFSYTDAELNDASEVEEEEQEAEFVYNEDDVLGSDEEGEYGDSDWGDDYEAPESSNIVTNGEEVVDKEVVKNELKRIFGVNFESDVVDNFSRMIADFPPGLAGRAFRDFIYISTKATPGTEYHEAFHRVYRLYLSKKARKSLDKGIKKAYDDYRGEGASENADARSLEEFAADRCQQYFISRAKIHFSLRKPFEYIRKHYELISQVGSFRLYLLYMRMNNGKFRDKEVLEENEKMLRSLKLKYKDYDKTADSELAPNSFAPHGIHFNHIFGKDQYDTILRSIFFYIVSGESIEADMSNIKDLDISKKALEKKRKFSYKVKWSYGGTKIKNPKTGKEEIKYSTRREEDAARNDPKIKPHRIGTYVLVKEKDKDGKPILLGKTKSGKPIYKIKTLTIEDERSIIDMIIDSCRTRDKDGHSVPHENGIAAVKEIFEHWDVVQKDLSAYLSSINIQYKQEEDRLYEQFLQDGMSDEITEEEENFFDVLLKYSHESAQTTRAAKSIKRIFSLIKRYEKSKTGHDVAVRNECGFHEFMNYKEVLNTVFADCLKIKKPSEMIAMFRKKASQGNMMYQQICDIIQPKYKTRDRYANNEQFITQLFNLVSCTQNRFKVILANRQKDGSYIHTVNDCGQEYEALEYRKTWGRLLTHFGLRLFKVDSKGNFSWYDDDSIAKLGAIYDALNDIRQYFSEDNVRKILDGYKDIKPLNVKVDHLKIDSTVNVKDPNSLSLLKTNICVMLSSIGIQIAPSEFDFMLDKKYGQYDSQQERLVQFFNDPKDNIKQLWENNQNNVLIKKEDGKWVSNVDQYGRILGTSKKYALENTYSSNNFAYNLSQIKYKYSHEREDMSVLVTMGKRYYTISENNYITDVTDELSKGEQIAEDLSRYCFNVFTDEAGDDHGSIILTEQRKQGQLDLKVCTLSQFKSDETRNEGHDYFDISEVEDYLCKTVLLSNGYIIFPTMSDKKTWTFLDGIKLYGLSYNTERVWDEIEGKDVEKTTVKDTLDKAYDQLIDYALCEYESVKQSLKQRNELKDKHELRVKNYHENWVQSKPYSTLEDVFEAVAESKYINESEYDIIRKAFKDGKESYTSGYRIKISKTDKGYVIKALVPNSCVFGTFNGVYDENNNYISFNTVFDKDGKFHSPEMNLKLAEEKFFSKKSVDIKDGKGNVTSEGKRSIIERIIDNQVEAEIQHMLSLGLIEEELEGEYTNKGLDSVAINALSEYTGESDMFSSSSSNTLAIKLFARDIVVKSIMSVNEVERVYSGNPAFYKYKYSEVEDGSITLTDRYSDEFKRLGGLISTGVNNNLEIKGMPEDGMYNCAIIDDVEVSSAQAGTIDKLMAEAEWRAVYRQLAYPKFENPKIPKDATEAEANEILYTAEQYYKQECARIDKELNTFTLDQVKKYVLDYDERNNTSHYTIIEKKVHAEISSYHKKINVADGAAYISPEMTEWLLRMCGSYDSQVLKAFEILKDPKSDIYHQAKAYKLVTTKVIGAQKYTAFGQRLHETGDTMVPYYNKMALFPIFKCIATGEFSRIYERMLNNTDKDGNPAPVHMLMMDSAVKIGAQGVIDYVDNIDNENFKFNTFKQPFKYLRKQFNTDPHHQEDQNMGTQMVKVALASLISDHVYSIDEEGNEIYGRDILNDIMRDIDNLSREGYEEIKKEFFNEDGSLNISKFSIYLQKNLDQKDADKSLIEAVKLVRDEHGNFSMKYPFSATSKVAWLQSILVSHINKEVVDVKTKGSAFYQRSVFGMEGATVITNEGLENVLNGGKDLEYIIGYDDKGNEKKREDGTEDPAKGAMDCVLSIDYFADILEKAGLSSASFEKQRQALIDSGVIGPNAKASLVGYRIPTQAQSSIHPLRCVDVLPVILHTIILPKEFTKVTGSDFDIDKIFIASLDYDCDAAETALWNSVGHKDQEKHIIFTEKEDPANRLINNYIKVLKDHTSAHIAHRSIDNDTTLVTDILEDLEGKGLKKEYKTYDFYCLRKQTQTKNEFLTGKTGIGPFALNNNSLILTMLWNVEFDEDNVMSRMDHGSLHRASDDYGRSVMSWISALINAHVDIAKDSYITRLNVNPMTYNLTNLLIRTGFGDTTFHFLTQPVMFEMAKEFSRSKSEFMMEKGKSLYQIKKEAKRKAAVAICGEDNVKWAEDLLLNDNGNFVIKYEKGNPKPIEDGARTARDILAVNNEDLIGCSKDAMRKTNTMKDKMFKITLPNKADLNTPNVEYVTYERYQAIIYVIDKALEKPANKLSEVVKYSKIDTKKQGKSITEQLAYARGVEKTFGDKSLMRELYGDYLIEEDEKQLENQNDFNDNLQKMYWESFIGPKTHRALALFANILKDQVIEASPAFQRTVNRIAVLLKQDGNDKAVKKISTALADKLKSKYFVKYAKDHDINIHKLFTGNNTIYDRLLEIQFAINSNEKGYEHLRANDGQSNNLLLKLLIADKNTLYNTNNNPNRTEDKINNLKFVRLFGALDATDDQNNEIIQAWENLLQDTNETVKTFARDLCVYAFFSSGDSKGMTKLFSYVPNIFREGLEPGDDSYVQYIRDLLANLKNAYWCDENLNSELVDDIVLNNYDDNTFVKSIDINSTEDVTWKTIHFNKKTLAALHKKLLQKKQQKEQEGEYVPEIRSVDYPIVIYNDDFVSEEELPMYVSVKEDSQTRPDDFNRGVHIYKRVSVIQKAKSDQRRAVYVKIQPRGYTVKGGYRLFEYGIHDQIEDYEMSLGKGFFSTLDPSNPIPGYIGEINDVVKAIQNWRGGNVLERRILNDSRTYAPKKDMEYGRVKYYGPTMGKTTAVKTNKNLVDFDDIAREPIKKLAEQMNMSVKELKMSSPVQYEVLLLNLIKDWVSDKQNKDKTLVVSNAVLAKHTSIFDNTPMIPTKKEFVRRLVERSEDTSKSKEELEKEAEEYYNDLINKWMPEGYKLEDRYVSELEDLEPEQNNNENNPEEYQMNSGGAYGADTMWDIASRQYGITDIRHYRDRDNKKLSKRLRDESVPAWVLSEQDMKLAREEMSKVLGKDLENNLEDNLSARNYYQIINSESTFAIAPLDSDRKRVSGGTNAAVQLSIQMNHPTYVFDTFTKKWYSYSFDDQQFKECNTPTLTKKFAGIGTRDVELYKKKDKTTGEYVDNPKYLGIETENAAMQAIRDVLDKTFGKKELGPETEINIWASTNENADLSNFAVRPFTVSGMTFQSVEQAFLYAKFSTLYDVVKKADFLFGSEEALKSILEVLDKLITLNRNDFTSDREFGAELKRIGNTRITPGNNIQDVIDAFFAKQKSSSFNKNWETDTDASEAMKEALLESFKQNPQALQRLLSTGNATLTHKQATGKWKTEFPKLLMEVRSELRGDKGYTPTKPSQKPSKKKKRELENLINVLGGGIQAKEEIADTLGVVKRGTALDKALAGVDPVFTPLEIKQIKEALNGKLFNVVSVDRGTDIAFFADEFIEFLKKNAELSFSNPDRVNMIELWSKHDGEPMQRILRACKQYKVACATSFSITGLGDSALEKGVMKHDDLIDRIEQLIKNGDLNPITTTIRIDPILVGYTDLNTIEHIVNRCKKLGIKKFVTSLVQSYGYTRGYAEYSENNKRFYNRHVVDGINNALARNNEPNYDWDKYYGRVTNEEYNAYWKFYHKYEKDHAKELEKLRLSFNTGSKKLDEDKFKSAKDQQIKKAAEKEGVKYVSSAKHIGDINHMPKQLYIDEVGVFLTRLNQDPSIDIETCAFSVPGMPASACLDPLIIERLSGISVINEDGTYKRDTSRSDCMCYGCHGSFFKVHKDCQSACAYCYAAHSNDAWYEYYDEYGNLIESKMTKLDGLESKPEDDHSNDTIFGPDGLTDEQRNAKNTVIDFIESVRRGRNNHIAALVQGKAGTGKTYTAIEIIKELKKKHPYMQMCVATTSRKAAHVLGDKAKEHGAKIETVYTLSGAKRGLSEIEFDIDEEKAKWNKFGVIFIDECSMISKGQWKHISKAIKDNPQTAFVFLGDKGLISGIDENNTGDEQNPIFEHPDIVKSFLNTRIRQGEESPILPFADEFWKIAVKESVEKLGSIVRKFVSKITNKGSLLLTSGNTMIENAIPEFEKALETLNPNHIKIIAAKNDTRRLYNTIIHNALFPDHEDLMCDGDLVIFNAPYSLIDNAEEFVINNYTTGKKDKLDYLLDGTTYTFDFTYDSFNVETEDQHGSKKTITVPRLVDNDLIQQHLLISKALYNQAVSRGGKYWPMYYKFRDAFADVDWAYSITSHKSQGSTYDISVVDYLDIYSGEKWSEQERARMLYTAITRAKYTSVILAPQGVADIGVERFDNDMTTVNTWPILRSEQPLLPEQPKQPSITKLENGKTYSASQMREYSKTLMDKKYHKLIDLVFDATEQLNIEYHIDNKLKSRGSSPRYSRTVTINPLTMNKSTIVHESIHQAVNYWLNSPDNIVPDNIKEAIHVLDRVRKELIVQWLTKNIDGFESFTLNKKEEVYKEYIKRWKTTYSEETYGLSSLPEFVAELCNGKILAMIDELDANEEKRQSIVKRIINSILTVLHLSRLHNASEKYTIKQNTAIAFKELLTNVDEDKYRRHLSFYKSLNDLNVALKNNKPQEVTTNTEKGYEFLKEHIENNLNINVKASLLSNSEIKSLVRVVGKHPSGNSGKDIVQYAYVLSTYMDKGVKKATLKFVDKSDLVDNIQNTPNGIKLIDLQPLSEPELIDNIDPNDLFKQLEQSGDEYIKMC